MNLIYLSVRNMKIFCNIQVIIYRLDYPKEKTPLQNVPPWFHIFPYVRAPHFQTTGQPWEMPLAPLIICIQEAYLDHL